MGRPSTYAVTPWRSESNLRVAYQDRGLSQREIADLWDTSQRTIWEWVDRHGIETRNDGARYGENHHSWGGGHSTSAYYGASWWRNRPTVLERDGFKCVICGIPQEEHRDVFGRGLEVHHITPFGEFDAHEAANDPQNLITMCRNCHQKAENSPRLNRALTRLTDI